MSTAGKPLNRALAAFNYLLAQSSAIHVTGIDTQGPAAGDGASGGVVDILAHVEVYGRSYTLACQVSSSSVPQHARTALEQLHNQIAYLSGNVTPVLILPVLSPQVKALCEQNNTGCLDLHGNGRLAIDEIFISIRSLPRRVLHQAASSMAASPRRSMGAQMAVETTDADSSQRESCGFLPAHAGPQHRALSSAQSRAR